VVSKIEVERPSEDGPFRVGDSYELSAGDLGERMVGTIVDVTPAGPNRVLVAIEVDGTA
jgi:hypothetical protein